LKPGASRLFASSGPKRRFGVADSGGGNPIAAPALTWLHLAFMI